MDAARHPSGCAARCKSTRPFYSTAPSAICIAVCLRDNLSTGTSACTLQPVHPDIVLRSETQRGSSIASLPSRKHQQRSTGYDVAPRRCPLMCSMLRVQATVCRHLCPSGHERRTGAHAQDAVHQRVLRVLRRLHPRLAHALLLRVPDQRGAQEVVVVRRRVRHHARDRRVVRDVSRDRHRACAPTFKFCAPASTSLPYCVNTTTSASPAPRTRSAPAPCMTLHLVHGLQNLNGG